MTFVIGLPSNDGMSDGTGTLFIDTQGAYISRAQIGNTVILQHRNLPFMSFALDNAVERDVAIATVLNLGWTTDRTAALCGVSHGQVCKVRERQREGGTEAFVQQATRGRPRLLFGATLKRVVQWRGEGKSVAWIAARVEVSEPVVREALRRQAPNGFAGQTSLAAIGAGKKEVETSAACGGSIVGAPIETSAPHIEAIEEPTTSLPSNASESAPASTRGSELSAGAELAVSEAEHPSRYAGLLLLCAASAAIGVSEALSTAGASRGGRAVYDSNQVLMSLMAAWGAGFGSLESMHERDAHALGVVLGLERSPSVRTMHRAIAELAASFDASRLGAELARGLMTTRLPERLVFGVDGHFKPYNGAEPIDKGWDSKRRIAVKGVSDVVVTDAEGHVWSHQPVGAGDALSTHLPHTARALRGIVGPERPIVLCVDRGGFDFDVLATLAREGFYYVAYVPASVSLPALDTIAPAVDGVGETPWLHPRVDHPSRLLSERDGQALIPATTNLPSLVSAEVTMHMLRTCRGVEENEFKAARAFAHIDRLVDRGGAKHAPDDRGVENPDRHALKKHRLVLQARLEALRGEKRTEGRTRAQINGDIWRVETEIVLLDISLKRTPPKLPRVELEPNAQRAWLDTRYRLLLQPLKFATENARRWLLGTLGDALAPTDHDYDDHTSPRTLLALLRAPGTVRFDAEVVTVTLQLPLPPTAHGRIEKALLALDTMQLRFTDRRRTVRFRLAPRPTREQVQALASSSK